MNWKTAYRSFYYATAEEPADIHLDPASTALLVIDVQDVYLAPKDTPEETARWQPFYDRMRLTVIPNIAALIADCRPWIEAFETGAQAMGRIAELAANGRLERDARTALRPFLVRLRNARVRVFGNALDRTLADLTGTHVRPGSLTLDEPGREG